MSYIASTTTYSKTFNKDGLVAALSASISNNPVNKTYQFDSRINIIALNSSSTSTSATASYDDMSRITGYNYGTDSQSYTYKTSSDRTSKNKTTLQNYTYNSASHRLSSVSGGDSYTYDLSGNTLTEGNKIYTYNQMGRIQSYNDGTNSINYTVGFNGERPRKIDNNNSLNNISTMPQATSLLNIITLATSLMNTFI